MILSSEELDLLIEGKVKAERDKWERQIEEAAALKVEQELQKSCLENAIPRYVEKRGVVYQDLDPSKSFKIDKTILATLSTMQFFGLDTECPIDHLQSFCEITDCYHVAHVTTDQLRLRLFPKTLSGKAKDWWWNEIPERSIHTWEQLHPAFMKRFYPLSRTQRISQKIMNFSQDEDESLATAYERFNVFQRKCPHHGISDAALVRIFTQGLHDTCMNQLDIMSSGDFLDQSPSKCWHLIEKLIHNSRRERTPSIQGNQIDFHIPTEEDVEKLTQLERQMAELVETATVNAINVKNCPENSPAATIQESQEPTLLEVVTQLTQSQILQTEITNLFIKQQEKTNESLTADIKTLSTHVTRIYEILNERGHGKPPDTTETPSQERVKAAKLRNGKELQINKEQKTQQVQQPTSRVTNDQSSDPTSHSPPEDQSAETGTQETEQQYRPPPPFPQRLQKQQHDKDFQKFLDHLRKLTVEMPFIEALSSIPAYTKYMKEILANKNKAKLESAVLSEVVKTLSHKDLPPKLNDQGAFNIPCVIGTTFVGKALCDLGASVNLMPLSTFKRLSLGDLKKTRMKLQLADSSLMTPYGIAEDVVVKIDNLSIPTDFIICDIEENREVPLILGRPFLSTGKAVIDMHKGDITFSVKNREVTFKVTKPYCKPNSDISSSANKIKSSNTPESYAELVDPGPILAALARYGESYNSEIRAYQEFIDTDEPPDYH